MPRARNSGKRFRAMPMRIDREEIYQKIVRYEKEDSFMIGAHVGSNGVVILFLILLYLVPIIKWYNIFGFFIGYWTMHFIMRYLFDRKVYWRKIKWH